jgi:hypothetical protein
MSVYKQVSVAPSQRMSGCGTVAVGCAHAELMDILMVNSSGVVVVVGREEAGGQSVGNTQENIATRVQIKWLRTKTVYQCSKAVRRLRSSCIAACTR